MRKRARSRTAFGNYLSKSGLPNGRVNISDEYRVKKGITAGVERDDVGQGEGQRTLPRFIQRSRSSSAAAPSFSLSFLSPRSALPSPPFDLGT